MNEKSPKIFIYMRQRIDRGIERNESSFLAATHIHTEYKIVYCGCRPTAVSNQLNIRFISTYQRCGWVSVCAPHLANMLCKSVRTCINCLQMYIYKCVCELFLFIFVWMLWPVRLFLFCSVFTFRWKNIYCWNENPNDSGKGDG